MDIVTFGQFRSLMTKRGWTPATCAKELRGIDEPTAFFRRVWDPVYEKVVIPYRSVIEFYEKQKQLLEAQRLPKKQRRTTCP